MVSWFVVKLTFVPKFVFMWDLYVGGLLPWGGGCPFGAGILGKGVILWLSWCHAGDLGIVIKFYY